MLLIVWTKNFNIFYFIVWHMALQIQWWWIIFDWGPISFWQLLVFRHKSKFWDSWWSYFENFYGYMTKACWHLFLILIGARFFFNIHRWMIYILVDSCFDIFGIGQKSNRDKLWLRFIHVWILLGAQKWNTVNFD